MYHISYIIYHISYIIYHISYIIYHISYIIYHISYIIYHVPSCTIMYHHLSSFIMYHHSSCIIIYHHFSSYSTQDTKQTSGNSWKLDGFFRFPSQLKRCVSELVQGKALEGEKPKIPPGPLLFICTMDRAPRFCTIPPALVVVPGTALQASGCGEGGPPPR